MQETGQGSRPCHPDPQFKFQENSFDGLKFLYDYLNFDGDIDKAKTIGPHKLTDNLGAYLMRSTVMVRDLFAVGYDSDQAEHRLSQVVTKLKEDLRTQTKIFKEVNKLLNRL